MKTIITNSQISKFFEKSGINLGITFEIVKDFHNCFISTVYLCYKDQSKKSVACKEDLILSHSTFKKIVSFTRIKEDSTFLEYLHLKVEKRMLGFLRFAKNKVINGKLFQVWRQYLHFKNKNNIKIPKINSLWFIVEIRSRSRSRSRTGTVMIASQEGGSSEIKCNDRVSEQGTLTTDRVSEQGTLTTGRVSEQGTLTTGRVSEQGTLTTGRVSEQGTLDTLKLNNTLNLEEFDNILTEIGLISEQSEQSEQSEPENFDEFYIKWVTKQIKSQFTQAI
jgi:hypothetical protein